jgi:hypothetical protein
MSDTRKKPGVAFWATVVVGCLMLYVVSFGPACWMTVRHRSLHSLFSVTFRPLLWTAENFPARVMSLLDEYALLGMPEPSVLSLPRKNPSLLAKGWTVFADDAVSLAADSLDENVE